MILSDILGLNNLLPFPKLSTRERLASEILQGDKKINLDFDKMQTPCAIMWIEANWLL